MFDNEIVKMGRITQLEIQLDRDIDEHYHYRPGENISGKVIIRVEDGEEILRILRINFYGMGTVSWKDELGKIFNAEEVYINQSVTLAPLDGETLCLTTGDHEFSFSYELPTDLPSSFIGKFGSVTYVIKASADDSRPATTISSEPFLIANQQFPFSSITLDSPVERSQSKRYWSKYRTGKITAKLSLKRQGFTPGDNMDICAEIINQSPKLIKGLQALLIMHSTFYAQNSSHTHVQVISKRQDKWEIITGEGRRWNNARLTVPTYAPESKLDGCDIIDIHYELVLKVEISTKKEKVKELWVSVPVLVMPISTGAENGVPLKKSSGETGRTIDRKTLESLDLQTLLDLQEQNDDTEFAYKRPVDDGTLRINPLFRKESVTDYYQADVEENTKL